MHSNLKSSQIGPFLLGNFFDQYHSTKIPSSLLRRSELREIHTSKKESLQIGHESLLRYAYTPCHIIFKIHGSHLWPGRITKFKSEVMILGNSHQRPGQTLSGSKKTSKTILTTRSAIVSLGLFRDHYNPLWESSMAEPFCTIS